MSATIVLALPEAHEGQAVTTETDTLVLDTPAVAVRLVGTERALNEYGIAVARALIPDETTGIDLDDAELVLALIDYRAAKEGQVAATPDELPEANRGVTTAARALADLIDQQASPF